MKKLDRFERAVEKLPQECDYGCYPCDVVSLLRKEHAWMRRQLKELSKIQLGDVEYQNGLEVAVQEMAYRLSQRRK